MFIKAATTLIAALVLGGTVLAPPAAADPVPLLFGAEVKPTPANLQSLEAAVGRQFDTTRLFFKWDDPFPSSYATYVKDTAHEMVISVRSQNKNGTFVQWADIANAAPGSAIYANMVRWAQALGNLGVPVFFTFNHEPEAAINIGRGTDADYIAAWRKFADVIRGENATNVSLMWITTAQSFRLKSTDRRYAAKWYPGDDYVDGIASDAYNWYTCRTNVNTPWQSLAYLIEGQRLFGLAHPNEILYLTEWGSTEDPATPGRKAQWITEAQNLFKGPAYAQYRGVSYFNIPGQGNCVWDVRSSASSLSAFSAMAADTFYGGAGG